MRNETWPLTVSLLPGLEAALGKVVNFGAKDFSVVPTVAARGVEFQGSPWPWRLSLKSSSVIGHKAPGEIGMQRAAGVFISYLLNPAMLQFFFFFLQALIDLRIICLVLKFLVLAQSRIILLFRYPSAGGWVGRQGGILLCLSGSPIVSYIYWLETWQV